jgi:RHS repeat-associated protein
LSTNHDKLGNLKTVRSSNANGVSIDYNYDSLNRLSSVTDNNLTANKVTNYTYDKVGNLESYEYGNGVKSQYSYNTLNRLTNLSISKTTTEIASYSYTLGAAGNRLSVTEKSGRTATYTYDDLYRLTNETVSNDPNSKNGSVIYTFDNVGNRLSRTSTLAGIANQTLTYDKNDRLTTDTYDANGNTKVSGLNNYGYDFENRLTSQNTDLTIIYDGDGNRVSKTVSGVTTKYLVDTNNLTGYAQVVEEIRGGSVQRRYTYGHDLISQTQIIDNEWKSSWYGYDGHGSVRFLTDTNGGITDTYDYDAFGNLIHQTGNTPNDYLYAGEQRDAQLGLDYLRARYMNTGTGRFWSMDSYEGLSHDPLSLHKYLYANADPTNGLDPSGMFTIKEALIVVKVISILANAAGLIHHTYRAFTASTPEESMDEAILAAQSLLGLLLSAVGAGPTSPGGGLVLAGGGTIATIGVREKAVFDTARIITGLILAVSSSGGGSGGSSNTSSPSSNTGGNSSTGSTSNNPKDILKKLLEQAKQHPSGRLEIDLDDGGKIVIHKDFGADAHPIGSRYPNDVDHYNIVVMKPDRTPGRFQEEANLHVIMDDLGNVIDLIMK